MLHSCNICWITDPWTNVKLLWCLDLTTCWFLRPPTTLCDADVSDCLHNSKGWERILMKFPGNDDGPRKSSLNLCDVLDSAGTLTSKQLWSFFFIFTHLSISHMWRNELLGAGLSSPSPFYLLPIQHLDSKCPNNCVNHAAVIFVCGDISLN